MGNQLLGSVLGTDMLAEKEALTPEMLTVPFLFSDLFCAFISLRSLRRHVAYLNFKKRNYLLIGQDRLQVLLP